MRVLFASIEWPFPDQPYRGPFAKSLADELSNYLEVIPLPLPVRRNPLNILKYRRTVLEAYHKHQCDHIHCYSLNTLLMVNPKQYPVSASAIGSDVLGKVNAKGQYTFAGQFPYLLLKNRIRYLQGIRCVSEPLRMKLEMDGIDQVPMKVLPNGIDLNLFPIISREAACANVGWSLDQINVFFPADPGREVKNFRLADQLVSQAETEVNLALHTFPGVPPEQMNNYYRAADVVLITSFHEGSSNALKEALLCKTPVLATPVGDAPYWLSLDVQGSLIEFDSNLNRFVKLLKHYSAIKRNQAPGIDQTIAKKLDIAKVAGKFASFLQTLN